MESISRGTTQNIQATSANPAHGATAVVETHSSGYDSSLTAKMLSNHSLNELNAKESQGTEDEKKPAWIAKYALESGQLKISPKQPASGVLQFGMQRNKEVVVIMIKPNERTGDDILRVGLRKENGEQLSMTLPGQRAVAAHSAPRPSALLGLPNELLLQITANTGNNDKGVNLSLRQVNNQMKGIADKHLSPEQRFFAQYAQTLSDSGYGRTSKKDLLALVPTEQQFALTNGPILRATAGYDGFTINDLAESSPAVQRFALTRGPILRATAGYEGESINDLAKSSPAARNFAQAQGPWLHTAAGYNGYDINLYLDCSLPINSLR